MRQLRKTSLTLLVWLTAAMTLVAGVPHFFCWCPDGRIKPVCLDLPSNNSSCCCGGGCCTKHDGGKVDPSGPPRSCCEHRKNLLAQAHGTESVITGACCTKTSASAEPRSAARWSTKVVKDLSFGLLIHSECTPGWPALSAVNRPWESYERPPPTDLVVVLQHLLI